MTSSANCFNLEWQSMSCWTVFPLQKINMDNEEVSVLKRYVKVFDLEADDFPKDMTGWENQILLMWNLAAARKEKELLKSVSITEINEPDFSFERFDNLYFHFYDGSL